MSSLKLAALSSLAALDPTAFRDVCAAVRHQLCRAGQLQCASVASSKSSGRLDIAAECFKSLWTALGSEKSKVLGDPSNVVLLVELWTELCSWIIEYLQSFIVEDSMTSDLQDSLAASKILNLLHLLSENHRLLHLMTQSKDIISCLTEVSIHLLLSETQSPSQYVPTMQIIPTLSLSSERANGGAPVDAKRILDSMAPARVTKILFRIMHLTELPATSASEISTIIRFLLYCSMCSSKFHANHLIHGSVPWICRLFARVLKGSDAPLYHHQPAQSCAFYLRRCTDKGPRWAAQAVERCLLELLLRELPHASDDFATAITGLFESIHVLLLFRGVLRYACQSLRRIKRLDLESHLVNASVSARETWEAFKGAVEDRWRLRDVVASKGSFGECTNAKCPNAVAELRLPVRRCQGCLSAFYCSRDCQKTSWPAHKNDCQRVQRERREGFSPQVSRRDLHFIRFVATRDVHHSADDVKAAIAKSNASANHNYYSVVVVNYTNVPRSIAVELMGREHLRADWPELMEQEGPQAEQLVRIIVPGDGGDGVEIFIASMLQ